VLGIPTRFIPQAKPQAILASLGLDAQGLISTIEEVLT
jgi:deoxyxylulose-5-phosphate synthase